MSYGLYKWPVVFNAQLVQLPLSPCAGGWGAGSPSARQRFAVAADSTLPAVAGAPRIAATFSAATAA